MLIFEFLDFFFICQQTLVFFSMFKLISAQNCVEIHRLCFIYVPKTHLANNQMLILPPLKREAIWILSSINFKDKILYMYCVKLSNAVKVIFWIILAIFALVYMRSRAYMSSKFKSQFLTFQGKYHWTYSKSRS